ncbi:EGF-like repeat and discoidin I-like domain-containing protein 3 [Mizuhopecten yessoensis]|uniref:EGF-like repeat and discoidin I-like domain-containing protein 3 n=1 Tax=Mizuhopecten yessoensis TaxID=6573 RepID=UPI000B45D924|nr:EGF-like repeat and discoidin I-like domain-containing protein 3 [Mizuhopecten yessoensis]
MVRMQLTCVVGVACLIFEALSCSSDSLVNGPNGVDNSSMTSSRDWSLPGTSICLAHLGRLNMQPYFVDDGTEYSAWCAPTNTQTDYLQVEFASLKTVSAISTQGRVQSPSGPTFSFYTKSYLVRYSNDGITWTDVMENNSPKVFPGNTDRETVVTNNLPAPVATKYIRVVPQSWSVSVCLRIDILGCDATVPSCATNVFLVNGPYGVDNSSMTSSRDWSVPGTSVCPAYVGRLHMQPYFGSDGTEYSSWAPPSNTLTDYLQVEFASLKTMVAVFTQGRAQSSRYPSSIFYTKSYLVRYSNDGVVWTDVTENNSPKVFPGNVDRDTVVTNYLPSPVTAKFVRLVPQSWQSSVCLRIDILGCDVSAVEPVSVNRSRNGTLWGYAGVAPGSVSITNITVNTTTRSKVECVTVCTTTEQCLVVSFEKATYQCIGYGTTNVIGSFTPSDPNVMSPDSYNTLYFNYGTVVQLITIV